MFEYFLHHLRLLISNLPLSPIPCVVDKHRIKSCIMPFTRLSDSYLSGILWRKFISKFIICQADIYWSFTARNLYDPTYARSPTREVFPGCCCFPGAAMFGVGGALFACSAGHRTQTLRLGTVAPLSGKVLTATCCDQLSGDIVMDVNISRRIFMCLNRQHTNYTCRDPPGPWYPPPPHLLYSERC